MMGAGIVMFGAGLIGLIAGGVIASEGGRRVQIFAPGGYIRERRSDDGMVAGGIALAVVSGVMAAVGIPLWAIGARRVPVQKPGETAPDAPAAAPKPSAIIRVGPTGASVHF